MPNLVVCHAGKSLENSSRLHVVPQANFTEVRNSSLHDSGLHLMIAPHAELRINTGVARTRNSDRNQVFQRAGRKHDSRILHERERLKEKMIAACHCPETSSPVS